MERRATKKSPFSEIHHIGIVVRDLDRAIQDLESVGIGPFHPTSRVPITERNVRGRLVPSKLENRFAQVGSLEIELTQPVEGECIQREFLETKGPGIHHLGFKVDDIWAEVDKLVKRGITIEQSGRRSTGGGFAFFKIDGIPGLFIEMFQRT